MSLNLKMEAVEPRKPVDLGGHPIKGLLCTAFGEHDGSLKEEFMLTTAHIPTLRVLAKLHPEVAELEQVIEYVEKHGLVEFWTE